MIRATGNMWDIWPQTDLFLITTNNTFNNRQALVMGAGIAKEARDKFPGLDTKLAQAISDYYIYAAEEHHLDEPAAGAYIPPQSTDYNLLISPCWPTAKLGAFQTKRHWRDPSPLELIKNSTFKLRSWCKEHPTARVDMPMPGVGHGQCRIDDVLQIISILPDSVHI